MAKGQNTIQRTNLKSSHLQRLRSRCCCRLNLFADWLTLTQWAVMTKNHKTKAPSQRAKATPIIPLRSLVSSHSLTLAAASHPSPGTQIYIPHKPTQFKSQPGTPFAYRQNHSPLNKNGVVPELDECGLTSIDRVCLPFQEAGHQFRGRWSSCVVVCCFFFGRYHDNVLQHL